MTGQLWDGVPSFYAAVYERYNRDLSAQLLKLVQPSKLAELMARRRPPPTRWQRARNAILRPFRRAKWALQDWVCRHICGCE